MRRSPLRRAILVVISLATAVACGSDDVGGSTTGTGTPTIVVTYSVLGAAVTELVGEAAEVSVIMSNGIDPHDYRPSPRDVEAISRADFVVSNGLDLEEGLLDAIGEAGRRGTPVFRATDHIEVRRYGAGVPVRDHDDDHDDGHDADGDLGDAHGDDGDDPHFWVDPLAMDAAMVALAGQLERDLGLDLADRRAALSERLIDLDARTTEALSIIPDDRRVLVTGHESMGYFAARYDFVLVGALIPSLTTQAAPSAGDLHALKDQIEQYDVPAIFNEIGTSPAVARTIADETGAVVIELPSHNLPDDGSYVTFVEEIAARILAGLGPQVA
jgi:zinc/manganese transport system substrate-binding protein